MNSTTQVNGSDDEFLDLGEVFRPIAKEYGRDMFSLVFNAGMARQAVEVLGQAASAGRPGELLHAVKVLASAFNQLSNDYVKKMRWEERKLNECEQAIMIAFAGELSVVEKPKIILAH